MRGLVAVASWRCWLGWVLVGWKADLDFVSLIFLYDVSTESPIGLL
jgi:hypothetical protein